jgi:hypothetical protein
MKESDFQVLINNLRSELHKPLSAEEADCGWTEASKRAIEKFVIHLKLDTENDPLSFNKIEYKTVLRGLDHWGISSGKLYETLSEVSTFCRNRSKHLD